jgi:serine/alanine adding enzyme
LSISPFSSPFQTPDFYTLVNSVPDFSADVFAVGDQVELKALCVVALQKDHGIKGFFSRRGIIYGGPLLADKAFEYLKKLLDEIEDYYKKKAIFIEVRNFFDYSQYHSLYKSNDWEWLPYLDIKLPLKFESTEKYLKSVKYNRRREIRLSIEEGAIFRRAKDIDEVDELYLILKELYHKKLKLPLPGKSFFEAIFNSPRGLVFSVIHNNKIIGGSFCFYLEQRSIYTMYYCGLRDYHNKIFPTHLSILGPLDFGIGNNLQYIDFMGAGLKGKEYGVRNYKLEFGGDLLEFGRFRKVNNRFLFILGEFGLQIMRKLKL